MVRHEELMIPAPMVHGPRDNWFPSNNAAVQKFPKQLSPPLEWTTESVPSTYPRVAAKKNWIPRDACNAVRPTGVAGRSDALPTTVPTNVCALASMPTVDTTDSPLAGSSGVLKYS